MSIEQQYYENTEFWKPEHYLGENTERFKKISELIPYDSKSLLDVGCGNGLFLNHVKMLSTRGFGRLCGTDRSSAALSLVQTEKYLANITNLPFADCEFDTVSALEVLEHLPQETYKAALAELSRVANKHIIISVPFNQNLRLSLIECSECHCHFNPNFHLRSFDDQKMESLLTNYGFKCSKTVHIFPERVMPNKVKEIIKAIGKVKRKIMNQPKNLVFGAICPACGHFPKSNKVTSKSISRKNQKNIWGKFSSLLKLKCSWKWIAAIYERSKT